MSLVKAGYYDKPEGQDCYGKMLATNSYAAAAGLAWSTIDVLMLSHTKGYIPTMARFAYNIGPMMGMASAFTLTTYIATNARGKDDRLNYFLGGMAAGGVYGAWRRNHVAGLVMGLAFGIAGVIKKISREEGWEFFPALNHHGFMGVKENDYTLMAERPRNWTTGKESS
ncbi:NADH dehydrogenase [ubiquinone] 1 alpha subcomplex subunit 11-like [Lucilia sericata]|uniref:NADH dehydrogenase [ubiquinone] 1 alpha subcomplex subunit 11 n=1 Tax=Lucilia sericata TaxID=13632 RepID=UPI0018A87AD6|nr:NADH dehydrogenase [ubiquinone] 1 alpha subcomplex subunit 11 [Lucilia sericata]XP_037822596.1 NADH dehydrogenase [ubiquinone] 1 alpha subcomplex subunit 11-like [Lucilia sericata]